MGCGGSNGGPATGNVCEESLSLAVAPVAAPSGPQTAEDKLLEKAENNEDILASFIRTGTGSTVFHFPGTLWRRHLRLAITLLRLVLRLAGPPWGPFLARVGQMKVKLRLILKLQIKLRLAPFCLSPARPEHT